MLDQSALGSTQLRAVAAPFDPARCPGTLTIGRLIELGLPLAVHCHRCGRCELFDADAFSLLAIYVPALERRSMHSPLGSPAPWPGHCRE